MKSRCFIVTGVTIIIGIVIVYGSRDWQFYRLTGRFFPVKIIERLNSPVRIVSINEAGLVAADGRTLLLPGLTNVLVPAPVERDILDHGVEFTTDGTIYALVRVDHWCGNDPVRFHLARVDLSNLLLVLGMEKSARTSNNGIDVSDYQTAKLTRSDLKELFNVPSQ